MNPTIIADRGGRGALQHATRAVLLILLMTFAGCDALDRALDVKAPSNIPAELTGDPSMASLLVEGMLADFDCAFGSYIVIGGLLTDELIEASALANRWPYDRRDVGPAEPRYGTFNCQNLGVYVPLSTARFTAEDVLMKLDSWTDDQVANRSSHIAVAATYSGYSHTLLGEGFCSGVLLDENLEPGGEVTPADLFARAEQRFTRAIQVADAAGNDSILSMARVGRARARLNLGDHAGAASDAAQVEEGFVVYATASNTSTRRQNRVYVQNQLSGIVSVGPEYRDLSFGEEPDPRVNVYDTGEFGADGFTPVWGTQKYTSESSPFEIATWEEAQLILAEALLADGDVEGAVDIISVLHDRAGLSPFSSNDADETLAHIIEERRRELFLESHRIWDVNRFDIQLDPPPGTAYVKGGLYGTTECLPLPNIERANNPNL